ncbi:hypothetical protein PCC7424_2338 [Gloeothece citriformis PCC 7424]|uniref:Uncharacterized protein n=1 Tax=Gloeothece citriformis (strain PCC 7424) TaxID=65393 RepID=B7KIS3_GLOC7|nr:hypothetical protein [Gloeothece citriformis]ACK70759.1 hypothetical protein PCC7424_2338 [Gloeothece citriformis PCC 7424]
MMSIQEQARFLQYRQRLRDLHRQATLLSRLSSEIRGKKAQIHQNQCFYKKAIAQFPLSLEVREKEIIQSYDHDNYKKTLIQPLVRHLRCSQRRTTAYHKNQPLTNCIAFLN